MSSIVPRLALLATLCASGAQASTFDIAFTSSQRPDAAQASALGRAEAFWEGIVTGYADGIDAGPLTIDVAVVAQDGPAGTLAVGYPVEVADRGGFLVPTLSYIDFDVADFDDRGVSQALFETLLHEIAHALGFGSLWRDNGATVAGSGRYTGAAGLAVYRAEFGLPGAAFVPLTLGAGPGSDEFHWDEDWAGGFDELMTPFDDGPAYLSATTIASFRDLGYTTIDPAATALPTFVAPVPLPAAGWLLAGGLAAAVGAAGGGRRGRQSRQASATQGVGFT